MLLSTVVNRLGRPVAGNVLKTTSVTIQAASESLVSQPFRERFSSVRMLSSSASKQQRIGFIGLGNMGLPMVQNLASTAAGDDDADSILVFDTNHDACSKASSVPGIEVGASVLDVAQRANLIVTMLPGDAAVDGVVQEMHQHWSTNKEEEETTRVVVDCSTVSPLTSQKWSKTLLQSEAGQAIFLDAPVSGGVKGASDGTLTFMLGGCAFLSEEEKTIGASADSTAATVKSLLGRMGSRVVECGPEVGAGAATKLCNNVALAAQMIGICEALNLGESLGVDPAVLTSVLNSSTAACWSAKVNNPHPDVAQAAGAPASRNYQGGFATNLMLKDLGLALQVANEARIALPLTSTSKELYQIASLQGRGSQDFGAMLQVLRGKTEKE